MAMHSNGFLARPLLPVTSRAHQKRELSLSLQSPAFLILYCINKARAAESERSFTMPTAMGGESREEKEEGEGGQ